MRKFLPFFILIAALIIAGVLLFQSKNTPAIPGNDANQETDSGNAANQLFFQSSLLDQETCLKARLGENRYQELWNNPDSNQLTPEEQAQFRSCFE